MKVMPCGAQYYRAPTPEPTEWRPDMEAMRRAGFNTVKIWAQWRWNNPSEGRYYFDDLDQLMDLAAENELAVVINTILDCAPAWLYRRYPDCVMIDSGGRRVGPVALPHRQIGGAPGPCFHHAKAMALADQFVAHVVQRYADHPALGIWDLWNEPELTVGMLRQPRIENLVCYCENSRAEFVKWLQAKYGHLDALNETWRRNYQEWDEVELPIEPTVYRDMIDWRMFFVETVTCNMERRAKIAREHDAKHPIMCHTVPTPHFNPMTCASDDWRLSRCCDLFGNSVGSDPMAADIMRAAARGKTVINAEIHAIPGGTFHRPNPIGFEEMKHHILVPLAHGIKGFLFWQYRPETLGAESPAWGLTHLDGSPAPWLDGVRTICRELVGNSEFFMTAEREKPHVAILTSPENEVFCWAASSSVDAHNSSLAGAYRALHSHNFSIDFVHPLDIAAGVLDEHSVLYVPPAYWLDCELLDAIKEWVGRGGNLIAECCFASVDTSTGCFYKTSPGRGFDEVFGVREGVAYPESGVFNSYSWRAEGCGEGITLRLSSAVGECEAGMVVSGYQMGAVLAGDAEVLATYPTGEAAITTHRYGRGSATMIGTMLGAAYSLKGDVSCANLIAGLVGVFCDRERATVEPAGKVRVDVLSSGGRRWIMVQNLTSEALVAVVSLPEPLSSGAVEMFTGQEERQSGGGLAIPLTAGQIKAYWGLP